MVSLPLALGLALTSVLRKELRANRDPEAKLAEVMEPISALSETSDVVFAALQISFLQEGCPIEVQAALAKYFVGLQNVSDDLYPAFEAMAKRSPEPFLRATHDAAFSLVMLPNSRWLIVALLSASADPKHVLLNEWLRNGSAVAVKEARKAGSSYYELCIEARYAVCRTAWATEAPWGSGRNGKLRNCQILGISRAKTPSGERSGSHSVCCFIASRYH